MGIEVDFQAALFARLDGATLGVTGVYDIAPQDDDSGDTAIFPYVTMGRVVLTELDSQTKTGWAAQVRIHTHSRTGSMLECKNVQGAIFAALHRAPLTISGFNNYSLLREDSDCQPMGDNKIHGVCEYRALIESV